MAKRKLIFVTKIAKKIFANIHQILYFCSIFTLKLYQNSMYYRLIECFMSCHTFWKHENDTKSIPYKLRCAKNFSILFSCENENCFARFCCIFLKPCKSLQARPASMVRSQDLRLRPHLNLSMAILGRCRVCQFVVNMPLAKIRWYTYSVQYL